MKCLSSFLISTLITFTVSAQTVNIPDTNFLNALIEEGVDSNSDGLIQVSEAEVVTTLDLSGAKIGSLIGINSFINLEELDCGDNDLDELNLFELPFLNHLECPRNELKTINLTGIGQLLHLDVGGNNISSLDLSSVPLLNHLSCFANPITFLDLSPLTQLRSLSCQYTEISNLDLSSVPTLTELRCNSVNISELDLSDIPMLSYLNCNSNNLEELNLSHVPLLSELYCAANNLEELDLSSTPLLTRLNLSYNPFTELKIENFQYLRELHCRGNSLELISVYNCEVLYFIDCTDNESIEMMSFRSLPSLSDIECRHNNAKNIIIEDSSLKFLHAEGNDFQYLHLTNLPELKTIVIDGAGLKYLNILGGKNLNVNVGENLNQLRYLCADPIEIDNLQGLLEDDVLINEYCPDDYNDFINLTGTILYGTDIDCTDADSVKLSVPLELMFDSGQKFSHYPKSANFKIKVPSNRVATLGISSLDTALFSVTPLSYTIDTNVDKDSLDYCISPKGDITTNDAIVMYSLDSPQAGFEHSYTIEYSNLGNTSSSGLIRFGFDSSIMQLVESSESWAVTANTLEYNYTDLLPFEQRSISITFRLNSPMDTPPLVGGESLGINVLISPNDSDIEEDNNRVLLNETVVNAYDPNDKICLQGEFIAIDLLDEPLHYRIRFENTGTASARNILVRDTIDTSIFDINSLRVINSSHDLTVSIMENIVDFQFIGINLAFEDEANDGHIIFSIELLDQLGLGTQIENRASIYFDYNWPIHTNTYSSLIVEDKDADGWYSFEDCDDTDSLIYPQALEEECSIIDYNCDGITGGGVYFYSDEDNDGFGDIENFILGCITDQPQGYVMNSLDCDDTNLNVNPETIETVYDGLDNDCNPLTLDDDLDQDGYELGEDCDDSDPNLNPNVLETPYDGLDNDCNPLTLDDDLDQDGFFLSEDCDDMNAMANPAALEIPNNDIDENCDGILGVTNTIDKPLAEVAVFPNPFTEIINIDNKDGAYRKMQIISILGTEVLTQDLYQNSSLTISTITVNPGVYFVRLVSSFSNDDKVIRVVKN